MSDDWYTKPGKVEKGPEFPVLDPAKLYTLKMVDITHQPAVTRVFQGESRTADEITTVWEVEGTSAKIWQRFTYSWNVKANMVIFINRMGNYLPEGQVATLAAYFTLDPPARIQCRLIPREKEGKPTGYYSIDINTVRGVDAPAPAPVSTPTQAPAQEYKLDPQLTGKSNPDVDRVASFLQAGNFSDRSQAEKCCMEFMGISDPAIFAAAWSKAKGATAGGK